MELTLRAREMYTVIREYFESGMTQIDFCKTRPIAESTFQYWLKRYREDNNNHKGRNTFANRKVGSGFIPIEITPSTGISPVHCEIERPNGTLIKLRCQRVSAEFLELLRIATA